MAPRPGRMPTKRVRGRAALKARPTRELTSSCLCWRWPASHGHSRGWPRSWIGRGPLGRGRMAARQRPSM
eukprot:9656188-Alexandrium_andersonii.AAC.1